MKAFLLAAGHGTRLRPITNKIPKCLVPVNGIPMMGYWFSLFRKHGISDVFINLNHFPEQVKEYVDNNKKEIRVTLYYEDHLLGSLGTILKNRKFVMDEEDFFIFYADNLTNVNLTEMYWAHKKSGLPFTMGLFRTNDPKSCGIAELDKNNRVIDFVEKPQHPKSDLANAGIYIMKPELLDRLSFPENKLLDIGFDLLPLLKNKMLGYEIRDFLLDIGTHKNYNLANNLLRENKTLFSYVS